jgi:DNA-directed RNA polymerase specialized sigma subunit
MNPMRNIAPMTKVIELSEFDNPEIVKKTVDEFCQDPSRSILHRKQEIKPVQSSSISQIDTKEVYRLYYEEKLSQRKVGEELGVPRWVIDSILEREG